MDIIYIEYKHLNICIHCSIYGISFIQGIASLYPTSSLTSSLTSRPSLRMDLLFSAMINILEYDIIVCNIKFRQCFWATFVPSETNATDRELSVDGPSRSKWHQFIFRPFSKLCLYTFPFRVVCILTLFMELMNAYLCTMV